MGIENLDTVDLEILSRNDDLRMVIVDGMPWGNDEDIANHFTLIAQKACRYLDIAESDQFREKFPKTTLDKITIALNLRYQPPASAEESLMRFTHKLALEEGVAFVFAVDEDWKD